MQGYHQIAGRHAVGAARVVSKRVNEVEVKRVAGIRGVEQHECKIGVHQGVH